MRARSMRSVTALLAFGSLMSATASVALATGPATADPSPVDRVEYVNLGDSFSAGSGVFPIAPRTNPICWQSSNNWAHDIASEHGYQLTDVSCGAAQTKDYFTAQMQGLAPQLDALSASTDLVTMTIGGNDSDTLANAAISCGALAVASLGQGSPCKAKYGSSFADTVRNTTYPALVNALSAVQAKAPNARVAIAGYLWLLPPTGGCFPLMPIARGDVPYLRDLQATLNDAVRRAAEVTGATYIDVSTISEGHDACRPIGTRWVEPALGSVQLIPVHPNLRGERAMADQAVAVLGLNDGPGQ